MELDYAILADAAVAKDGYMHIICGGLMNFHGSAMPIPVRGVLAMHWVASRADLNREHLLEITFIDQDGNAVAEVPGVSEKIPANPNVPQHPVPGFPFSLLFPLPFNFVVSRTGIYTIDIRLDGRSVKRLPITVNLMQQQKSA